MGMVDSTLLEIQAGPSHTRAWAETAGFILKRRLFSEPLALEPQESSAGHGKDDPSGGWWVEDDGES